MEFKFGKWNEKIGDYEFEVRAESPLYSKEVSSSVYATAELDGEKVLDGFWNAIKEDWEWYYLEENYGIVEDPEECVLAADYAAVDPEWKMFNKFLYSAEVLEFCAKHTYDTACAACGDRFFGNGKLAKCPECVEGEKVTILRECVVDGNVFHLEEHKKGEEQWLEIAVFNDNEKLNSKFTVEEDAEDWELECYFGKDWNRNEAANLFVEEVNAWLESKKED